MAGELEIENISRETIKPSSPTPNHLRNFKLSFLEQIAPVMYTPIVLFYSQNGDSDHPGEAAKMCQRLKTSLSKILTLFYPFAGRFKDHTWIECNDEGADFLEAQVSRRLSDILRQPDANNLRKLLPIEIESMEAVTNILLRVQATIFECGGMAIGVCLTHKLTDAHTLSTFIKSWAATALGASQIIPHLEFLTASVFPPKDPPMQPLSFPPGNSKTRTRRLVFTASKIAALKARAASACVQQPSRVEAVTALIWKCSIAKSRTTVRGCPRLSQATHAVNLRKWTRPPMPANCVGNVVGILLAETSAEGEIELQDLVCELRKGKHELVEMSSKKPDLELGEATYKKILCVGNLAARDYTESYSYSSWCGFPLYDADFGWGKPAWMTPTSWAFNNMVLLVDAKDGEGIEAWVNLDEDEMLLFEQNEELLAFAVLNPSVLPH